MNTIKIYLQPSGDLAELYKDFNLFQGEYQNKLVTVFVPTSLLAPDFYVVNENGETLAYNVAGTAVKMSITHTDASGKVKIGRKYALNYVKTLTKNNIEYALFERLCPKEFTHYQGTVEQNRVIINVVSIDLEQDPAVELETLASQNCGLEVLESQDLVNQDEIEASEADILNAKVTNLENTMLTKQDKTDNTLQTTSKSVVGAINENKGNIGINTTNISTNTQDISELDTRVAYLEEHAATPETYVGQMTGSTLPTQEQLTAFVVQTLGRQPKNADVIIFIEQIAGGTDKNYKYIYSADGWNGYEIPPIESAGNGSLGLIAGTYTAGNTANLLVDIVGGEIKNIYLKDNSGNYRNAVEYTNTLNDYLTKILSGDYKVGWAVKADQDKNGNDIVDTYLTQAAGASKQYVRNYALPREFNDVNFIEANGFVDDPPTTPESGIQYTVTTSAIGSTTLCELTKQNTASFELTKKNSTSTTFYVTANRNCTVQFRLTVQIKLANIDWKVASVELSSAYNLIAGNVTKIDMGSTLNQLNADVLRLDNGDLIKLLIEIVTEDSVSTTFNLYSNDTYPSTFYLNTQAQILYTATGKLGQQPLYKVLGELNNDGFVFNIDTAEFAENTECYFDLTANYTGSISDATKLSLLVNGESIVLQSAYSTEPTIAELKQLGLTAENGSLAVSFKGFVLNVGGQLRVIIAEENLTEYAKHKEITTFALTGEELTNQLQGNFLRVGTIVIATTNYEDIIAGGVYKVIATESGLSYELLHGYQKGTVWGEITGVLDNQTDLKTKIDELTTNIGTNTNSITNLQQNKADKTEIPINADFTLAGLSEKSYNSLTDKPVIPEGVKLYDTTGQNTDGAMTQKATTDELAKKLDTTKGVTIDTEQTIGAKKTFNEDIAIKTGKGITSTDGYGLFGFYGVQGAETLSVGNVGRPLKLNSQERPKVYNGLGASDYNEMAFITDITTALETAKAQWLLDMNPIGTIIENNTGTNPSTYIGGTWELYGQGRVTVCIDSNDLSFDTAGETGGSKALQRHTHTATFTGTKETGWFSGYQLGQGAGSADGKIFTSVNGTQKGCAKEYGTSPKFNFNLTPKGSITIEDAGTGDQANLQPYIVVYRWVRTA